MFATRHEAGGGRALPLIDVDLVSDVVELNPLCELLSGVKWSTALNITRDKFTWEALKTSGNQLLTKKQPERAIRQYTLALGDPASSPHPAQFVLLLNRVQAYLNFKRWHDAYRDCLALECLISSGTSNASPAQREKVIFRKACAVYGLRAYTTARELIEKYEELSGGKGGSMVTELKENIAQRLTEATSGIYDWHKIFLEMHASASPDLDVADYTGPVGVRLTQRMGRGLFTTRDVEEGELLFAHKSLVGYFPLDAPETFRAKVGSTAIDPWDGPLLERMVMKVHTDPLASRIIHQFSFFRDSRPEAREIPSFDTTDEERLQAVEQPPQTRIDVNLMFNIMPGGNMRPDYPISQREDGRPVDSKFFLDNGENPIIIYGLPTMVNHSCVANVSETFWGDVAVLRALYPISKGTELSRNYASDTGAITTEQRGAVLLNMYSIFCLCPLCNFDREDAWEQRDALMPRCRTMSATLSIPQKERAAKMSALRAQLDKTYFAPGRKGM
ncbi:hypothetical protein IAT38_005393 [Cryptococcus sp. DSM 104549]